MNALPASIESYLLEAGFTSTELLVLKKLLEEDALTLRELAAKTGKSTGVLDQALKKLLRRNIVTRESINETGKYHLVSLAAIVKWMEEDTRQKQEMLKRRHQNFQTFIESLQLGKTRPEMEYFDGKEGIEKAYKQLLQYKKEMLHYFPVTCSAEDDPMRDFRVQYFRERRSAGVFARYIVHNTPLGRRFASRDPFEYRKTLLVPEEKFPMSFEKVIVDDIVACINHAENKVCFIRYKELAETERQLFERIWQEQEQGVSGPVPVQQATAQPDIPLSTRTLSGLREFFMTKKSFALFGVFAVASALVTYGLYRQNVYLNTQRIRERAISIAATGAMQFDTKDLDKLRSVEDVQSIEYARVLAKLNEIRAENEGVRYTWIMRPTDKEGVWEFVADADSLDPNAKKDLNKDGVIDEADHLSPPGEIYEDDTGGIALALLQPFADQEPTEDQWGSFISGMVPIKDASGKAVAVFGVDVEGARLYSMMRQTFNAALYFVSFFLLFVFIRLAAFNKSLFLEVWQAFKMRRVLITLALCAEIAFFVTLGLYYYTLNIIKDEMAQKLMAISATATSQFDPTDLDQLHFARDMKKEAYQKVFRKLNEIRDNNERIKWAYIFRPAIGDAMWEFVADADTNYNLPYWEDLNGDGEETPDELNVPPGIHYYAKGLVLENKELALSQPTLDDAYTDQWGTFISGSAPVVGKDGTAQYLLGFDIELSDVYQAATRRFMPWLWFLGFFSILVSARFVFLRSK